MSGILPDTGNVESEVHIHSLSLGKDKFNFSNKELVESSWKMKKKSPSQQRREERRKLERTKKKVAEKVTESDVVKVNKKVCKVVSEEETESSLYFNCDQCDFKSASEKGLRHHIRMKHRISQLDGVDDTELNRIEVDNNHVQNPCPLCEDGGISCTGKCEDPCAGCEEVRSMTELDIIHHIMNEHEPIEVFNHFGREYVIQKLTHN